MKKVLMPQDKYALVDDEDYEYLNQWKWHISNGYAVTYEKGKSHETRKHLSMHRLLLSSPKNMVTDHINHNKLDNRRENIRICTQTQNNGNMRGHNKFGCKGVEYTPFNGETINKRKKPWGARLQIKGKKIRLGYYKTKEEAMKAYNQGALKYFGEFSYLN